VVKKTPFTKGEVMKKKDDRELISEKARGYFEQGFN
jgi:hypothetical protein